MVPEGDSVVTRDQAFHAAHALAKTKRLGWEDVFVLFREYGVTRREAKVAVFGKKHVERLMARELLRRRA